MREILVVVYSLLKEELLIYLEKGDSRLLLTTMRENELIGLITCLSRAPRTASAQALEDTELQKVSFEVLKST